MIRVILILLFPSISMAWAEHHAITRKALSEVHELDSVQVEFTSWEDLLKSLGYSSTESFNESIQIRKDFHFEPKLGEAKGKRLRFTDVLSTYSDEPDWDMDKELFEKGEYPELWKDEYQFMGGTKGTPSQAFRHMYWVPFSFAHPLATFKLPVGKLFSPMGEAPARAKIFVDLARRAMKNCQPYWAARFWADASHYLEDVSSPFHATQTPSKKFIFMAFTDKEGRGFHDFVQQVTHVVSYYHFAFEDYIGHLLTESEKGTRDDATNSLTEALARTETAAYEGDIESLVMDIEHKSLFQSANAANASLEFFPKIDEPFDTFDPQKFMDLKWWQLTMAMGETQSPIKDRYFSAVQAMFTPLGDALRSYVLFELKHSRSAECALLSQK